MKRILYLLFFTFCFLPGHAQTQIPGTKVTSSIVPNDVRDNYPTHVDTLGYSGYRSVATKAERNAIKSSRRQLGMMVYVRQLDSTYVLRGGLTNAFWRNWLPNTNQATYNMVKSAPPEDYFNVYPYKQTRTPIYFRDPFITNLYYMRVNCYNDRGMVPYLILEQKPTYFSIDVAEACTCTWEARALN